MTILLVKNKTAKLCREALRQNTYLYLSQDSRDMLEDIIKKEEYEFRKTNSVYTIKSVLNQSKWTTIISSTLFLNIRVI